LDYEPNEFILVYYRGQNDAWIGYGGAVVYSRSSTIPKKYIPRIKKSFAKANVDFDKFIVSIVMVVVVVVVVVYDFFGGVVLSSRV